MLSSLIRLFVVAVNYLCLRRRWRRRCRAGQAGGQPIGAEGLTLVRADEGAAADSDSEACVASYRLLLEGQSVAATYAGIWEIRHVLDESISSTVGV